MIPARHVYPQFGNGRWGLDRGTIHTKVRVDAVIEPLTDTGDCLSGRTCMAGIDTVSWKSLWINSSERIYNTERVQPL